MSTQSSSMSSSTASSGDFPIYPSERPSVADAKAWRLGSTDVMPPDWKALSDGIPPHSLVHLIACPVPPVLVEDLVGPPIVATPSRHLVSIASALGRSSSTPSRWRSWISG